MNKNKIIEIISGTGLVDHKVLSTKEAFALFPEILDELLQGAIEEFKAITNLPLEQVTFENTVEEYLNKDRPLEILYSFVNSMNSTDSSDATRSIIEVYQPKFVDYHNMTSLSKPFYDRLKAVQASELDAVQQRSVDLMVADMEYAGVHKEGEERKEIEALNKKIATLQEKFSLNTIDAKQEFYYEIEDEDDLGQMPESDKEAAKEEARKRELKAPFVFTLSPPSYLAVMKYCSDRKIREAFYRANVAVATKAPHDNRPLALEILQLRQQKAEKLGFKSYTQYVLQRRMADSFESIESILKEVGGRAKVKAQEDLNELKKFAGLAQMQEWDITYYAEKLRQEKYAIDSTKLREYFPLESVLEGLFKITEKLFGVTVKKLQVESYHPDVRTYEVYKDGSFVSYYVLDPFARESKRAGAWADALRTGIKTHEGVIIPIVINVCNFPKPAGSMPALLTHRDVETIFHEFGHALHVMLSSQNYANLNGFNTEWDFVELPSQILENWCWNMESLSLFAKHYETGEVIPEEMVEKLRGSKRFMSGYMVLRQNEFGFLDILLHTKGIPKTIEELDQRCLEIARTFSLLPKIDEYYMYASFGHIFAGGYAAGYYSYVWAEILEADIFKFIEEKGILDPEIGRRYADMILAQGAKKDGKTLFKEFMERDPELEALFEKHAL